MWILLLYIGLIALINWIYEVTPLVTLPGGDLWSPVDIIVGFVFVIRDFAQRRVGHYVLLGMLAGIALSLLMVSKELAFASAAAFAVGELADWAIFTATGKPFSQRILLSSLLGAPLDSLVFLTLVGLASPLAMQVQISSKLAGALLVFYLVWRREKRASQNPGQYKLTKLHDRR